MYAPADGNREVRVGRYRIDAVRNRRLIEIQLASLSAIRHKVADLLTAYNVTVVKPIVRRRLLIKRATQGGPVVDRRWSPKQGSGLDVFHDLVYFTSVFPHGRLRMELLLLDLEEDRVACPPRRRRRWSVGHRVDDQRLVEVVDCVTIQDASDLWHLLPGKPDEPFDTTSLAQSLRIERWFAQRITYVLRQCGAIKTVGKKHRAWQYVRAQHPANRRKDASRVAQGVG